MTTPSATRTPAQWLIAVLAYTLVAAAAAIHLATEQPWLGLSLSADADAGVRITAAQGPSAGLPTGARLRSIGNPVTGALVTVSPGDLMEEPDVVADYREMDAFFARQGQLASVLANPSLTLHWEDKQALAGSATVQPVERPIASLPLLFWFQVVISVAGCLIACWVWVLRPGDWGARLFGITGLLFPVFTMPAAVYSTRELALPQELFFTLSALNHWGAFQFGAALIGILLSHPRQLVRPPHLLWPFVVANLVWLTDVNRIAPDLDWGNRYLVMGEMMAATAAGAVQWRRSRASPVERASLRWLIVSLLLGSGLFILLMVTTASLGWLPPMPQGYAFGFFLFIYIGIALGLRRYRLFELDEWAYRMLLWVGGAILVLGLDALLIAGLGWAAETALGASVLIVGLVYLPARQWLWERMTRRAQVQLHELMPDVVRIAFEPVAARQQALWEDLLRRLFDPLALNADRGEGLTTKATVAEEGLSLVLPACAGMAAIRMRHAGRGRRLFSPKDATFVTALCELMTQADRSRQAREQSAREERQRVLRDIHDDVGARLLTLIHRAPSPDLADLGRAAMNDLRTSLAALDASEMPLEDAIADWRAEAANRCEAARIRLHWQAPRVVPALALSPSRKSLLERALRESISNAIKHGAPQNLWVGIDIDARRILLRIDNDGASAQPATWQEGRGLRGLRQRLAEQQGDLGLEIAPSGAVRVSITLPLDGDFAT